MKTKTGTYSLRLPVSLRKALEDASKADGVSINQFVVTAIAEKLSALKTAEYLESRSKDIDVELAKKILQRDGGQQPDEKDVL